MRILMLSWEYPPKTVGGLARHVYDLTKSLSSQGEEIYLLTSAAEGIPEIEVIDNIHIYRVNNLNLSTLDFTTEILQLNFAFLEKAIEIIEKEGSFDVVHAHDWLVAFVARAIKHAYRIPLLSTIHATEYGRNKGLHNEVQRYISDVEWWMTYESWKVIVCSNYMKAELKNIFDLPDDKIYAVPNGVDPENFKYVDKSFRIQDYCAENEQIVFFVGRLVTEKGVDVLLDAAPKVLHYFPETKFIIAGKGPREEYLRTKAHMMGIESKIFFTGFIDDSTRNGLYKNAKVAVFPSTYEPFGIVALEGMATNTPVVVSDVGGLSEIVEHGIDGMKAYPNNPNSLADNIIHLLKNPELADIIQKKAYEKIINKFNWDNIARETSKVYEIVKQEAQNTSWDKPQNQNIENNTGRYSLLNAFAEILKKH